MKLWLERLLLLKIFLSLGCFFSVSLKTYQQHWRHYSRVYLPTVSKSRLQTGTHLFPDYSPIPFLVRQVVPRAGIIDSCLDNKRRRFYHHCKPRTSAVIFIACVSHTQAQPVHPIQLQSALDNLKTVGFDKRSWKHLEIVLESGVANHYAQNVRSWDGYKRQQVRSILHRFRRSFHEFPRPW